MEKYECQSDFELVVIESSQASADKSEIQAERARMQVKSENLLEFVEISNMEGFHTETEAVLIKSEIDTEELVPKEEAVLIKAEINPEELILEGVTFSEGGSGSESSNSCSVDDPLASKESGWSGIDSVTCHYCGHTLPNASELELHVQRLHAEVALQCHICDFRTSQLPDFQNHLMNKHPNVQPRKGHHKCQQCDYMTTRKMDLYSHIMSKHSGERLYKCQVCDYTTARESSLYTHVMKKHSGEHRYKCSYCDYTTTQMSSLYTHIMGKHTGEHTYKCQHCSFSSSRKLTLYTHITNSHTAEGLFKCQRCNFTTSTLQQCMNCS